ncbi:2539_t:CDS:2 [Rhizophagus irregularis]|nr:2539_t:CDS:2 [Rhizophagus irregularis]
MDIRAVVAIDFGTTFFVLQYDSNYQNVIKWGNSALSQKQSKHDRKNKDLSSSKTVELFKLYLGNIPQNEKPLLPYQLNYEKAISDYLRELAEFEDRARYTMRKCLYNAGLTDCKESKKVEFTTEPEAAAIYCGTVDLTTRRLLRDNKLSEIIERTGDFCGGSYVDREFLKFLSRKLGEFSESKYLQMRVKEEFGKLVSSIIIPKQPIAAIVRGACDYTVKPLYNDMSEHTILSRRRPDRQKKNFKGNDKTKITKFHRFVTRGTKVGIDEEFHIVRYPLEPGCHSRYITTESSAEFCDELGMKLLGTLSIELPDVHLGLDRKVEFSLIFGKLYLVAKAKNLRYRRIYDTSFELDF